MTAQQLAGRGFMTLATPTLAGFWPGSTRGSVRLKTWSLPGTSARNPVVPLALRARDPQTFGKETDPPHTGRIQMSVATATRACNEVRMEDPNLTVGTASDVDSTRGSSSAPVRQPVDEKLQKLLDKALYGGGHPSAQKIRNFLNGTWLGEPLHVVLTDVPVGAWTVAMAFDALDIVLDRREFARACETSIGIGLLGAAGAAVTGMTDWSDVDPPARRLGLIHGLLNLSGTALFATSLFLRKRKSREDRPHRGRSGLCGYELRSPPRRQIGV